jgi:hypothetical protein
LFNDVCQAISTIGFPIVVTLLLLKYIAPNMATKDDIREVSVLARQLERNVMVLTVVLAKSTGVDYAEAKRLIFENGAD